MYKRKRFKCLNKFYLYLFPWLLLSSAHASFIEATIGTAVVNDATAAYYNPAALVLLKNPQLIPMGTLAYYRTRFSGQSTPVATGITQTGSSSANTHYFSPALYFGIPTTDRITAGIAIVSNNAYRDTEQNSILRYVQASNDIQDFNVVPAVGIKITEYFSVGAGINFSYLNFHLQPITAFPGSNITDSQSNDNCDGTSVGADLGLLLKPSPQTLIGFNYRSSATYRLSGSSVFNGSSQVVSNDFHFTLHAPARSTLSINHFVTQALGFIATIQRFQWSILKNIHVNGIASLSGATPVILNANVPYYLHDTWLFTLGGHYRFTPQWVLRVVGSYNQSPGNGHYQISNGDSLILAASMGYAINKKLSVDGGYAHAFIKNETINISGARYSIYGVNEGSRDAVSLKLTLNL